jgi:hypothetical protein
MKIADDDLALLDEAWEAPAPPAPIRQARARAELLAHAAGEHGRRGSAGRSPRRRGLGLRAGYAAGVAVVVAAGVTVAGELGGTGKDGGSRSVVPGLPGVPTASAAELLERAATAAEGQPFSAPRDDQWIFSEERITSSDGGAPVTSVTWRRADGGGLAVIDERGRLQVERLDLWRDGKRMPAPFDSYRAVAALPTEPGALLRWAYEETEHISGAGSTVHAEAYSIFRVILGGGVLPPDLEAAIFRAIKRIPGVTVTGTDALGEPTLALALTDEWLRQALLLDPKTYAYRGQRSTVVKDTRIDPLKAGNATGKVEKGHTVVAARVAAGVVDEPGERP